MNTLPSTTTPNTLGIPPELLETLSDLHKQGAQITIQVGMPSHNRVSFLQDRIEDRPAIKEVTKKLKQWSLVAQREVEDVMRTPLPESGWDRWKIKERFRVMVNPGRWASWESRFKGLNGWFLSYVVLPWAAIALGTLWVLGGSESAWSMVISSSFCGLPILYLFFSLNTGNGLGEHNSFEALSRKKMQEWWPWARHIEGIVKVYEHDTWKEVPWHPDQVITQSELKKNTEYAWEELSSYIKHNKYFDMYEERKGLPPLACLTFEYQKNSWDNRTPEYLREKLLMEVIEPIFLKAVTDNGIPPLALAKLTEYVDEAVQIIGKIMPNRHVVLDSSPGSREKLLSSWPSKK